MKAFVIKNKEGKYLTEMFDWSDDLYFAMTWDETHELSEKDQYWQEITIAEGDLDHKIAVLERALELTCGVIKQYVKIVYGDDTDKMPKLSNLEDYYLQVAEYGVYKGQAKESIDGTGQDN